MSASFLKIFNLFLGYLVWAAVATPEEVGFPTCDTAHDGNACHSSQIEAEENGETAAANIELLQTQKHKQVNSHDVDKTSTEADLDNHVKDEHTEKKSESGLVSKDHNDNMCLLCGKPLAERVDREYPEFRTDCGSLTSATGPNASTLAMPAMKLTQTSESGVVTNGFCQLNFAKSCVDAVANKDYLYWAKSINLKAPDALENAAWDGRYCRLNGFLQTSMSALQHDFHATQAKADELCRTKYAKYNLHNITFMDMMSATRYDDKSAPTLEEAELLAAWNCAMGDLGCDLALCAYSFCEKGSATGLYEQCEGWHPVHGMPVTRF